MTTRTSPLDDQPSEVGARAATAGGVLAALAMTSCCILPLVAFSLGATGAWIGQLGALYQYKWILFAFAAAALFYGFFKVYVEPAHVCASGACARPLSRRLMKVSLWIATSVTGASMLFSYVAPYVLRF